MVLYTRTWVFSNLQTVPVQPQSIRSVGQLEAWRTIKRHDTRKAPQQQQEQQWQSAKRSRVWTGNEAELLLNVKQEYKDNKTQKNAIWCLSSSAQWENRHTFIRTSSAIKFKTIFTSAIYLLQLLRMKSHSKKDEVRQKGQAKKKNLWFPV